MPPQQPLATTALALALGFLVLLAGPSPTARAQSGSPLQEKAVKPYAHTNSKGKTYYLFGREQKAKNSDKVFTMYYFASDPENKKGKPLAAVPEDRVVSETKTGLLVLKKKK